MSDRIRVLIVDDHQVVREGLRSYLEVQDDIEIAGEAANGEEACTQAAQLQPDVVLMDLVMPRLDGVAAMRRLRREAPAARAIVLTSFSDDERIMPALRAGAAGYLLKTVAPAELARAIRAAHHGEALLDPSVAARLMEAVTEPDHDPLTQREREVLTLIGRGFANKRIALELGISESTVKAHVGNLLAKLGVADRTQAALHAQRLGLTD